MTVIVICSMKNGEIFQYKGERTRELMVDYAERMAQPPIQHVYDSSTLKDKMSGGNKFFLFVGDQEGSSWVKSECFLT